MTLSPEREQQIRATEGAATPGPWHRHDDPDDLHRWVIADSGVLHIDFGYRGNSTQRDAEFVADARTAVPELLAELDRLRAELAVARSNALHEAAAEVGRVAFADDGPALQWNWWDAATIPASIAALLRDMADTNTTQES